MLNLSPESTEMAEKYIHISNGIFLLLLAVSGNFVAETLGCRTQYALSDNMYLKNLIILFMIYFTINYTATDVEHPLISMKNAVIIWIIFVLFGRLPPMYTLAVILLLILAYILNNFRKYYKVSMAPTENENATVTDENKNEEEVKKYANVDNQLFEIQTISIGAALILILGGSLMYLRDKKREYGKDFKLLKFIFGVKKCSSLD